MRGSVPGKWKELQSPPKRPDRSAAHPASYTMGTGSLPGVMRPGRDVEGRVELHICSSPGHSWPVLGRTLALYINIYIILIPRKAHKCLESSLKYTVNSYLFRQTILPSAGRQNRKNGYIKSIEWNHESIRTSNLYLCALNYNFLWSLLYICGLIRFVTFNVSIHPFVFYTSEDGHMVGRCM